MTKRLTRSGNSLALVIDRPLLEALDIDADTELELSTDGDVLVVTPLRDPKAKAPGRGAHRRSPRAVRRRVPTPRRLTEPLFLTLDEVLTIHADQIRRYGGRTGLRDLGSLQSALGMPETTFEDELLQGTSFEMAAACLFHIARSHSFVDENERTALMCALVYLGLNGGRLEAEPEGLYELVDGVAAGSVDKADVAVFLCQNSASR